MSYDQILRDCSDIIAFYKEHPDHVLYRGLNHEHLLFRDSIATDRQPRDTPIQIHNIVEKWMIDNGFNARRSNSLFCTSDYNQASDYGTPYVVFPVNGFSFTYWDNCKDLFVEINEHLKEVGLPTTSDAGFDRDNIPLSVLDYMSGNIGKIMGEFMPIKDNLVGAFESENEIMISGDGYWAIGAYNVEWELLGL